MTDAQRNSPDQTLTLVDVLTVLFRYRRFIAYSVLGAMLLAAVVSFILPRWYEAEGTILPPPLYQMDVSVAALVGVSTGATFGSGRLDLPFMSSYVDVYKRIIEGHGLALAVIDSLSLRKPLGASNAQEAVVEFKRRIRVQVSDAGTLKVTYTDTDPSRASAVVSAVFEQLDEIVRRTTSARDEAGYEHMGRAIDALSAELKQAEDSLSAYQSKYGVVAIDERDRLAISMQADLLSQLRAASIERRVFETAYGPNHPSIGELAVREAEIGRALREQERGSRFSLAELPVHEREYVRLRREVDVLSMTYESLKMSAEQFRTVALRTGPYVQVLDPPYVPSEPAKPQPFVLIALAGIGSLCVAIALAALSEWLERLSREDPEGRSHLSMMAGTIRSELRFWKRG